MDLAPWTQLYHRKPLLTGYILWPEESCLYLLSGRSPRAVLELSAPPCVYLGAFIFACGSCYHSFCPCFIFKNFLFETLKYSNSQKWNESIVDFFLE